MIDFRSEPLCGPTDQMWDAMRTAAPGWVYTSEDAAINELEQRGAEMLGQEEALLVPTCQMANLMALMVIGERGTQAVFDAHAHVVDSEHFGLSYIAGLFPRLIDSPRGILQTAHVEEAVRAHERNGRTSVVCIENSHTRAGGTVMSAEETVALADVVHSLGAYLHLDGARIFNAAASMRVPVAALSRHADTVSVSLNKALSAPYGAILAGSGATISMARENLWRIGGASIQAAGFLAAAALVALDGIGERVSVDNQRAQELGALLSAHSGLRLDPSVVESNIVLVDVANTGLTAKEFVAAIATHGVLAIARDAARVRFVTHRLIGEREVERAGAITDRVIRDLARRR